MSDRDGVLAMINGAWMCQAIGVACAMGLPDRLAGGARNAPELAAAVGASPDAVARLLHGLATLGLVNRNGDASFTLTARGALLTTSSDESLHAWAVMNATRGWAAWTHLAEGVRRGRNVRDLTGLDRYVDFRSGDANADVFNRAMGDLTRPVALALRDKVAFRGDELVVDVGGGAGHLVVPLLAAYPAMRGSVLDLEHARPLAERELAAAGLGDRCRFVAGSFFDGVPPEGDVYFLKSVLHNWDDAHAVQILMRCREAMRAGARLIVLERVLAERTGGDAIDRENARSDLQMMLTCDGRERCEAQFRSLLGAAGLRAGAIAPLTPLMCAIETTSEET